MTLTYNQFQRELHNRVGDPQIRYMMTFLYEQQVEMIKQQEQTTSIILQLANSMQGVTALHGALGEKIKKLERAGRPDGIDVFSVGDEVKI